ncbi:SIR2 family protein, partial [Vibrio lentus]
MSSPTGETKGVPDVKGMLHIIEETLNSMPDLADFYYEEVPETLSDTERYQRSFTFLLQNTSQDVINDVIRKAVLKSTLSDEISDVRDITYLENLQKNTDAWVIPPAIDALAKIISSDNKISGPILTTNFDPLMSVALNKLSVINSRFLLHGDCNINALDTDAVQVVHLHGFWTNTDTLHTPDQLEFDRPKLRASLNSILNNKTLLVIGYGGWSDVFTRTLFELIQDDRSKIDIIWCFYGENEERVNESYQSLIESVGPAIQRGRFRAYGGIDCHKYLPELESYIFNGNKEVDIKDKSNFEIKEKTESCEGQLNTLIEIDNSCLPQWSIIKKSGHSHIRESERSQVIELFRDYNCVNLVSEWGLSRDEFVSTIVEDESNSYFNVPIFRVDMEGIRSNEELTESIESYYSVKLTTFINSLPDSNALIYMDNFGLTSSFDEYELVVDEVLKLIEVISDYKENIRFLIASAKPVNNEIPYVEIKNLEEYDIRKYISYYKKSTEEFNERVLDGLIQLSKGVPVLLDKYIDELEYLSIDDVIESHYSPESYSSDNDYNSDSKFTKELVNRVNLLKESSDQESLRSYELLKILSVLEHGDAFSNIKRAHSKYAFKPVHIQRLYKLDLVDAISSSNEMFKKHNDDGGNKVYVLPTLVREYVYSNLTTEDVYEIANSLADIHLGKRWKEGRINLNSIVKDQLKNNGKLVGSTNVILLNLLKCSIDLDSSRGITQAFNISIAYCKSLSTMNKHVELSRFCSDLKSLSKDAYQITSFTILHVYEGKSLRMQGKYSRSEIQLNKAYEEIELLSKYEQANLLINMTYLFEVQEKYDEALDKARQILDIDPSHTLALIYVAEYEDKGEALLRNS